MSDSTIIVITIILVIIGYTPLIYKINRRLDKLESRLDEIETKFNMNEEKK